MDREITRRADGTAALDDEAIADLYAPPTTPWLRVNIVSSLDGAATVDGASGPLSSPADQRLMGLLRMRCDALLVGAGTFRAERYGPIVLPAPHRRWRRAHGLPEHPTVVVVSGSLDLDQAMPAFAGAPTRPVVLTVAGAPAGARAALAAHADVWEAGPGRVAMRTAIELLHRRGLRQILCEGGPTLLGDVTAAGLVDEVCLTVSPVLAGPGAARVVAGAASPLRTMSLRHVLSAGDHLLLRYVRA